MAFDAKRKSMVEKFIKIPHDEVLQEAMGKRLYAELEGRFENSLIILKTETDYDCAKLVVVILTPEIGKSGTLANTYGIPFIVKTCDNMGIDFYNLTPVFQNRVASEVSQLPEDGGWTKEGAAIVADQLAEVILKYDSVSSGKAPSPIPKPETFGDLQPKEDEVVDGDRNLPYHLKVNSQGLRMDNDVPFPKKKQTILILGDGQVYNPFLDNEFIATTLLQRRFPEKEIINAGVQNYTVEDYQTLYRDKARYTEPDIVILCTNGGDVLDYYFSQRNRYSRSQRIYPGSEVEHIFYNHLFGNNQ